MTVTETTLFLLYAAFVKLPCVPFGRKLIPNEKNVSKLTKKSLFQQEDVQIGTAAITIPRLLRM